MGKGNDAESNIQLSLLTMDGFSLNDAENCGQHYPANERRTHDDCELPRQELVSYQNESRVLYEAVIANRDARTKTKTKTNKQTKAESWELRIIHRSYHRLMS